MPRRFQVCRRTGGFADAPFYPVSLLTCVPLHAVQKDANIAPLPAAGEIGTDKGEPPSRMRMCRGGACRRAQMRQS